MFAQYVNLDLKLYGYSRSEEVERFRVLVEHSEVGEQQLADEVAMPLGFREQLVRLERRAFDRDEAALAEIGIELGKMLLPPGARRFFFSSLSRLQPQQGLRLRIKCASVELDGIPWEFAFLERGIDGVDVQLGGRGFIARDTRISIARYELGSQLAVPPRPTRERWRLLAVACEPQDRRDPDNPLQTDHELSNLRDALTDVDSIEIVHCVPATRAALQDVLLDGAEIFHFAGHGEFRRAEGGARSDAYLLLEQADGRSDPWEVDALAQRLANKGIRIAVLGACKSAQTDGANSWAGIAASLVRAGIPVVIGMQYTVYDASAIAFSKVLYRAWTKVSTIDEAVAEARSAIVDLGPEVGRDFATPVLYMRLANSEELDLKPPVRDARPATSPVPPAPPRPSADLGVVVARVGVLYDYKLVHDALHSARMGPYSLIQLRSTDFPGGSTVREFGNHCRELKMRLQDIRRVAEQGRCDAALMQEIIEEFAGATASLEQALADRDSDRLEDALAAFDTLLGAQPSRVDTWMVALAQQIELGGLIEFLSGLGVDVQALDEMRHRGERLRKSAAIHTLCQSIDNRLGVIRKAAEAQRFREIRRQWKSLSESLVRVLPDWSPDGSERLRQYTEDLGRSVAASDEPATCAVFEEFCADFDYGFYTVDSDLKQLCGEMKEDTAARMSASPRG